MEGNYIPRVMKNWPHFLLSWYSTATTELREMGQVQQHNISCSSVHVLVHTVVRGDRGLRIAMTS